MSTRKLILTTIGVLAATLLAGCGAEEQVESTPPAATPTSQHSTPTPEKAPVPAEVETGEAPSEGFVVAEEQLRVQIEIPSYYPEDGPVYPGLNPSQTQQMPDGKVSLMFGTEVMADDASSVMVEEAEAKGWTITSEDVVDRGHLVRAEKDGRQLLILTNRIDGGGSAPLTLVAVSVEP